MKIGEALTFKYVKPTLKEDNRGLMSWSCISANGVGKVVVLEDKVSIVS